MEQALYRKYRPRDFKSAVAQDHIVSTLKNAVKSGRISHAYLFTGPRGVGKTSIARILAHEINRLPYSDDSIHLDIIEIDAASNRRIDEIRDLRERVRVAPAAAKYKVYIIDEVHMLTREAFNALLKTLEEPPAHAVFILATTEAHKLPETIISRTQRFEFKPVNYKQMTSHLATIAKQENIDITPGALELLAKSGEGSFRDSIGYLDQLGSHGGKIDEQRVRQVLGLPSEAEMLNLLRAIEDGSLPQVAEYLENIQANGVSAAELAIGLSAVVRQKIMSGTADSGHTRLLKQLLEVKGSSRPQEFLEIVLLEAADGHQPAPDTRPPTAGKAAKQPPTQDITKASANPVGRQEPAPFQLDDWPRVVDIARSRAASIYTALKLAEPSLQDGRLVLQFKFGLHQKKLEQAKNKALVAQIIDELFGQAVIIDCVVNKQLKTLPVTERPSDETVHSISNIFGSAEMIET